MRRASYRLIRLALALANAAMLLAEGNPGGVPVATVRVPVWLPAGQQGAGPPTETGATALKASDFEVTLNGDEARVLQSRSPQEDQIIVVVLDLVGDLALVQPAKDGLIAALSSLRPNVLVALLRAQDGVTVLADPTNDREALAAAIRELPVSGKAGLLEALEPVRKITDSIAEKSGVRTSILYVTDSDVLNYREDFSNPVINSSDRNDLSRKFPETLIQEKMSQLQPLASAEQSPMFIVHLLRRTDRLNSAYQGGLKSLASITAGEAEFCGSSAEIPDAISAAMGQIAAEYTLSVMLPVDKSGRPAIKTGTVALEVTARSDGSVVAGLQYRTRLTLKKEVAQSGRK